MLPLMEVSAASLSPLDPRRHAELFRSLFSNPLPTSGMSYTAVKSYKATKSDEISVNMGNVVEVVQKSEDGWWLVRCAAASATQHRHNPKADRHKLWQCRACRSARPQRRKECAGRHIRSERQHLCCLCGFEGRTCRTKPSLNVSHFTRRPRFALFFFPDTTAKWVTSRPCTCSPTATLTCGWRPAAPRPPRPPPPPC